MVYDINISILGNSTVSKTSKKMTERIWARACLRVEPAGKRRRAATNTIAGNDRKGNYAMESVFVLNQVVKFFSIGVIALGCGQLVAIRDIKVNYTRKIMHFSLFFIPVYLDQLLVYEKTLNLIIISFLVFTGILMIYIKPLRERSPLISLMFKAFDRPEDRPHTLVWLFTQVVAGYIVIVPMIILFSAYDLSALILVPILITAIGDGLAEPVGVRFGRHKYQVSALFTDKKYFRTLEGSACVFIASLVIIAAHHAAFTPQQFIAAMVVMPVVMTLTEAFSPHTWDSPTLFLAGYLMLFGISFI